MDKYSDIIKLARPISHHIKMSMLERAAQFSPFSALKGYEEELGETSRHTDIKKDLVENEKNDINSVLNYLKENKSKEFTVSIDYFSKDVYKQGGKYLSKIGKIKKIDEDNKILKLQDNTEIDIRDISSISVLHSLFE